MFLFLFYRTFGWYKYASLAGSCLLMISSFMDLTIPFISIVVSITVNLCLTFCLGNCRYEWYATWWQEARRSKSKCWIQDNGSTSKYLDISDFLIKKTNKRVLNIIFDKKTVKKKGSRLHKQYFVIWIRTCKNPQCSFRVITSLH